MYLLVLHTVLTIWEPHMRFIHSEEVKIPCIKATFVYSITTVTTSFKWMEFFFAKDINPLGMDDYLDNDDTIICSWPRHYPQWSLGQCSYIHLFIAIQVARKHFFRFLQNFESVRFRISVKSHRNVSSVLHT